MYDALYDRHAAVAPPTLAAGEDAALFDWTWAGPSLVTLDADGSAVAMSCQMCAELESVSLVLESAAIQYVRVAVALHRSVLACTRQRPAMALHHAATAAQIAQHCAATVVPLHSAPAAACDRIDCDSPLLAKHFWERWLGALLVAHARYCTSLVIERPDTAIAAAFDSVHLAETAACEAPPFVASYQHAAALASSARQKTRETLAKIALYISAAGRAAGDRSEMALAARILYWCGTSADAKTELAHLPPCGPHSPLGPVRRVCFTHDAPSALSGATLTVRVPAVD